MYNFFWFFLTTAREEGVPRGRSEFSPVQFRPARYTWIERRSAHTLSLMDVLDFAFAVTILFTATGLTMLLCLGVITIVPSRKKKKRKRKK